MSKALELNAPSGNSNDIQDAIASLSRGTIAVGSGVWNTTRPIRGKEGVEVVFDREAIITPQGDFNAIEVVRGARFIRPRVDYRGRTKAAIYVDGVNPPISIGQDLTLVDDPWIEGSQTGTAIFVNSDAPSGDTASVEWMHITRPRIRRMGRAIVLQGAPFSYTGKGRYVHTITIAGAQISGCVRYIDILGKSGGHLITELAMQTARDTEALIYCEGGGTLFTGRVWDPQLAAVERPFIFTADSNENVAILPATNSRRIQNDGTNNLLVTEDWSKKLALLLGA